MFVESCYLVFVENRLVSRMVSAATIARRTAIVSGRATVIVATTAIRRAVMMARGTAAVTVVTMVAAS